VFGPLNLDIFADVGRIVAVIDFRRKGIIAEIVSYGHLRAASLGLLPYQLVPVVISLPEITSILRVGVTYYRAL
jgi:hypothetical protein